MRSLSSIGFKVVQSENELDSCFSIRKMVFIEEQAVPEKIEIDNYDEVSEHFLVYFDEKPIATARLIKNDAQVAKIGRVAVLKDYRGKGLGKILMQKVLEHCRNSGINKIEIDAQTRVIPFYEKLGFRQFGKEFLDANIPHYKMELEL